MDSQRKVTVLLEDDTVGYIWDCGEQVGDTVEVALHDENGMPIFITGKIAEFLD